MTSVPLLFVFVFFGLEKNKKHPKKKEEAQDSRSPRWRAWLARRRPQAADNLRIRIVEISRVSTAHSSYNWYDTVGIGVKRRLNCAIWSRELHRHHHNQNQSFQIWVEEQAVTMSGIVKSVVMFFAKKYQANVAASVAQYGKRILYQDRSLLYVNVLTLFHSLIE